MVNENYNKFNYRNNPINFYYEPARINYIIRGSANKRELDYKPKFDPWEKIMQMNLEYLDYKKEKEK